jgi:hypothetical protein
VGVVAKLKPPEKARSARTNPDSVLSMFIRDESLLTSPHPVVRPTITEYTIFSNTFVLTLKRPFPQDTDVKVFFDPALDHLVPRAGNTRPPATFAGTLPTALNESQASLSVQWGDVVVLRRMRVEAYDRGPERRYRLVTKLAASSASSVYGFSAGALAQAADGALRAVNADMATALATRYVT